MVACWVVLAVWVCCAAIARAQLLGRPRCPNDALQRCAFTGSGHDEYSYTVDGWLLHIEYTDGGYFVLKCSGNLTLDNPALPRFDERLRVDKAGLEHCPPPRRPYAAVLRALNVVVLDKLTLSTAGRLTRALLAGLELPALVLESLELAPGAPAALVLEGRGEELPPCGPDSLPALDSKSIELSPCGLDALPALTRLRLSGVRSPPGAPLRLPPALEVLQLVRTGAALPPAVLARLPRLARLNVRDSERVVMDMSGVQQELALEVLALEAKAVRVSAALLPSLRQLTLQGWAEPRPAPWAACAALDTLKLIDATARELPADWLQSCTSLRVLHLHCGARQLTSLDPAVLRCPRLKSCTLEELRLTSCALTALPEGLLDDAKKLRVLDFSGNLLLTLPGGLFASTKSLQELNLSRNRLTTTMFASLSAVTSLTKLWLSNNVGLKDSCGGAYDTLRGTSSLQYLKNLTELHLSNTSAQLMCRDWRESMPALTRLDLSHNRFTVLTYQDLQFRGYKDVTVILRGNNVTNLSYTRKNYEDASEDTDGSHVTVQLDERTTLRCDCHDYWAALALRRRGARVRLLHARCAGAVPLQAAPPDELLCAAPALCRRAPPGCTCAARERLAAPGPARVLRLACERAGLRRVPAVSAPPEYAWDLRLAHNNITVLRAQDLPTHLDAIDLRNNSLSDVDAEAAGALVADLRRRVWLATNPLPCGCAHGAVLDQLRARRAVLQDYAALRCAGGAALAAAHPAPCAAPRAGVLAAAGAALALLAAAALGASLALPAMRRRVKRLLRELGCLRRPAATDGCRYDVFVSFSHGDEPLVRGLVARLERDGYRLCVHYRDWAPGGWIPAQIAASVRAARRTLAVVSAHFLRSEWARAEFREAHALALRGGGERLVVVLLDAPERLPLDQRLRGYLASNTYVRWGDPWFWQKLHRALPRGRPAPPQGRPAPPQGRPAPTRGRPAPAREPPPVAPQLPVVSVVSAAPQLAIVPPLLVAPQPPVSVAPQPPLVPPVSVVPTSPSSAVTSPDAVELPLLSPTSPSSAVTSPDAIELPLLAPTSPSSAVTSPDAVELPLLAPTSPSSAVTSPDAVELPLLAPTSPSSAVTSPDAVELPLLVPPSCSSQYNGNVTSGASLPLRAQML